MNKNTEAVNRLLTILTSYRMPLMKKLLSQNSFKAAGGTEELAVVCRHEWKDGCVHLCFICLTPIGINGSSYRKHKKSLRSASCKPVFNCASEVQRIYVLYSLFLFPVLFPFFYLFAVLFYACPNYPPLEKKLIA